MKVSRHSNSLRTTSLVTQTTSFFDMNQSGEKFWRQIDIEEEYFSDHATTIENEFQFKNKSFFSDWKTCTLCIKGNFLIFKKKKKNISYLEYIDFDECMYKVEVISQGAKKYSNKYPFSFSIYSNGKYVDFYCKSKEQFSNWLSALRKFCVMSNFHDFYKIQELIGSGGYGKVHVVECLSTGAKYAGKFIKFSPAVSKDRQKVMITNEIRILRRLNHPHIVKLYEVFEMQGQVCLVMDLVQGEKLFTYITMNKLIKEETAAFMMKQILITLSYLENQDIIHRDLKPENILYTLDDKGRLNLKIIDFGLATYHRKKDMIKKCGTAGYVAPEILNNEPYNHKVDLFSAGVILYVSLTRRPAFYGKDYEELMLKNKTGIIRFKGSAWNGLTFEAQDLIQKLLEPTSAARIPLADALNHEWLLKNIHLDDRKDLSECMFNIIKLNIPDEDNIAVIPTIPGRIPYINKANIDASQVGSGTINRNISRSFVASDLLGIDENRELASFYKRLTKDLFASKMSSNSSKMIMSKQSSLSLHNSMHKNNNLKNISKASPLLQGKSENLLPNLNLNSPNGPVMQPISPKGSYIQKMSKKCRNRSVEAYKFVTGYEIRVSIVDSAEDMQNFSNEEGSPCSLKYEDFKRNSKIFSRNLSYPKRQSLFELDTALSNNIKIMRRLETDPGPITPRIKTKVAPINQNVRDLITNSFDNA